MPASTRVKPRLQQNVTQNCQTLELGLLVWLFITLQPSLTVRPLFDLDTITMLGKHATSQQNMSHIPPCEVGSSGAP